MKLPAIQFYPADWRKDPGIQALTFEERGIWFEIICLMHESSKRGILLLNGKKMSNDQLSRVLGLDKQILTKALTSIEDVGVSSFDPETGALMNRRMVRDENLRQVRKNCGSLGGNPILLNQKTTTHLNQITTPSSSASSSASNIAIDPNSKETENGDSGADLALQGNRLPVKTVPPARHDLLKLWQAEYPAAHDGEPYHHIKKHDYPMDELLSKFTPEKIMQCARNGWKSKSDYIRNVSSTFDGLNQNWNKIINDSKNVVLKPDPVFFPSSLERSGLS